MLIPSAKLLTRMPKKSYKRIQVNLYTVVVVFYTERFFKWYRNLEYQKMKESILRTVFFSRTLM